MTREEAIENHRKMWNWIADETEKRKKIVFIEEYFIEHNLNSCFLDCYCCHYTHINRSPNCETCPVAWGGETGICIDKDSPYFRFSSTQYYDYKNAAKYAREIANLPERKIK